MSQYGAPFHVWKQWLSMSNMCRPVDPRRSFAEVFKTCSSKYENTSSLLPSTCKSKVSTSPKRHIHQAVDKLTSFRQGKCPCVHKSVYKGQIVDPVPCFNRFDPLKQFDTQELVDQTENSTVGHTGHKVKSKVKLIKHSNAQKQCVHKLVQQVINSQTINDIHRSVDPVTCHGRFESLKPGYVQDTGKNQSQLSPVDIESNDGVSKVNSSNNFCSEFYEQGRVEQLQQGSDFGFQAFDKVNESILKPLPECTAHLGSDFGAISLTPLQTY